MMKATGFTKQIILNPRPVQTKEENEEARTLQFINHHIHVKNKNF